MDIDGCKKPETVTAPEGGRRFLDVDPPASGEDDDSSATTTLIPFVSSGPVFSEGIMLEY